MRCIAPILGKGSSKHDPRYVPCGVCGYCLRTHQLGWSFRLGEESDRSVYPAVFLTPTYADEHLPYTLDDKPIIRRHYGTELDEVTLVTRHLQLFFKLVRQFNRTKTSAQIRYYAAGEYGERYGRPHYHIILFNCHPDTLLRIHTYWPHGSMDISPVRSAKDVSAYVAGYIVSARAKAARVNKRPFATCSKRPFLGHTYVTRMYDYHKKNQIAYLDRGKFKQALPRIFKNKIFEQWELNAMKQPAFVQHELALENELHRLRLLNGDDYDAFNDYERTRIHNEQSILRKMKHNDKHEFYLATRSYVGSTSEKTK